MFIEIQSTNKSINLMYSSLSNNCADGIKVQAGKSPKFNICAGWNKCAGWKIS